MLKIGLTGSIGSGKSIVSEMFSVLGIPVYIADYQAKKFLNYQYVKQRLVTVFSPIILDQYHEISRPALAEIVFKDETKLKVLNSIIHPLVKNDFGCWCMLHHANPYIIQEAAIIFESGFERYFDYIITVTAPESIRIERVMKRDDTSREDVFNRMKMQLSDEIKVNLADFVIKNDGDQFVLPQVLKIHQKILDLL
jgi:dephospho-CoA kinase